MPDATDTLTLTDFLLARIAEDESDAHQVEKDLGRLDRERAMNGGGLPSDGSQHAITLTTVQDARSAFHPARVLAECEAKRRIVEATRFDDDPASVVDEWLAMGRPDLVPPREVSVMIDALRILASVYADHPDYREEWLA